MLGSCLVPRWQHFCWETFPKSKIKAEIWLKFQYQPESYQNDWSKNLLDFGRFCYVWRVANWHWPVHPPDIFAQRQPGKQRPLRALGLGRKRILQVCFGFSVWIFFVGRSRAERWSYLLKIFLTDFGEHFWGRWIFGIFFCWDCWSFFVVFLDDFWFVFW